MPRSRQVLAILDRLAVAEEQFLHSAFLAPVPFGGHVCVRLAGVVCRMRVEPTDFEGWGIFQPTAPGRACLLSPANLMDRRRYLELFPRLRLVLCRREGRSWLALPAHRGDRRFRIKGLVPIRFVEDGQLFDVVEARFDGVQSWYDRPAMHRDPGTAAYLRQALQAMMKPEQLGYRGLTPEERFAYVLCRNALAKAQRVRNHILKHSEYDVAGICLSDRDRQFELQSLVGVLCEVDDWMPQIGMNNDDLSEERYWRMYPARS